MSMQSRTLKTIRLIVNRKASLIAAGAILSTFLCRYFNLTADFPLTIIATAIIFPIVFSIGGAYKRRESALDKYGDLKAHGRAIYLATRDWLELSEPESLERIRNLLGNLLIAARNLFTAPINRMNENERAVYKIFSEISLFIKDFRKKGLATGEVSRCNQFLSKMIISFESVKHIYQYRTPRTLRAYSDFFIILLPIIYGPYFAAISKEFAAPLAYVMPILFTLVLAGLDNIQQHLENPFDQIGEDDVLINAEKFTAALEP